MKTYKQHAFGSLIPRMRAAQFKELKANIAEHGLLEPIKIFQGEVLDGWNRYQALGEIEDETGKKFGPESFAELDFETPAKAMEYVVATNIARRHLDEDDRLRVAMKVRKELEKLTPAERGEGRIDKQAAEAAGVSERTVTRAARVEREGSDELREAVEGGKIKPGVAEKLLKADPKAVKKAIKKAEKIGKKKVSVADVKRETGMTDISKKPVPKSLQKIFGLGDDLEDIAQQLARIMKQLKRIGEDIPEVYTQTIIANLGSVTNVCKSAAPAWVCRKCEGTGKTEGGKNCNVCKAKGHVATGSGTMPKWD